MRLLSKTNRYYFIYTTLLLSVIGIIFYIIINHVIKEEVAEILESELSEYLANAKEDSTWLSFQNSIEFEISQVHGGLKPDTFADTLIQEKNDDEKIPYLQLTSFRKIRNKDFKIITRESLIESEGILFAISVSMILLMIFLLLGLLLLNNYLSKTLWKPFYQNLEKIKSYHVIEEGSMEDIGSDIQEFQELNNALIKMTSRINKDFISLKEFTENASHEIQTPLAIIKSTVDVLLQQVKEETLLDNLEKIEKASNRIAKTNQALLLLTRIENQQYTKLEEVNIGGIIKQSISDFEDFIQSKNITVKFTVEGDKNRILLNKALIQILINNLLSNAIKHNVDKGYIHIHVDNHRLVMENSGLHSKIATEKFFERFYKGDPTTESPGLGLSIIKQICDTHDLTISYHLQDTNHKITIQFPKL